MKVLVCATEYYPDGSGIANVAYNVVKELEDMGIECTICSPTGPDIILGSPYLIKKFGILGILHYWHNVSQFFKTNNYDITWLHNPFFLRHNPFQRYLVTMHITLYGVNKQKISNSPFLLLYKFISLIIERYCLNRLDASAKFSCVSQTVCNELKKLGVPENNITFIINGVNIAQFSPQNNKNTIRNKFGLPKDDIVLLSIGRLTHQKQPFTLIKIFSQLEKKLGDVTLCITGKGILLEALKDLVNNMGLRNVIFLGYVNEETLPDLYACADYYITTSKYEGLPLTLLEAMASGLPCIVSDIPNMRIVKEADCGIIVDFTDINNATSQIYHYLKGDNIVHAKNARVYTVKNLDWRIISKKYLMKFREIQ